MSFFVMDGQNTNFEDSQFDVIFDKGLFDCFKVT